MIERFTTDESPYFGLLAAMEDQLQSANDDKWPSLKPDPDKSPVLVQWLEQVKNFGVIRKAVASDKLSDNKATEKLTQRLSQNTRIVGELALAGVGETGLAKGKEAYKLYKEALKGFNGITASRSHAYTVAREGFEDNPAEAKSALLAAQKAVDKIRSALTPKDSRPLDKEQDPFWRLINEPLDELWHYTVQQAACHLQTLWDQEVVVKAEGVYSRHQLVELLFGNSGISDKFIAKHAGPFLIRTSRRGYYGKEVRGCAIPFKNSYFSFLKKGKRWNAVSSGSTQNHVVNIVAFPTDVNIEARIKPHMTRLVLEGQDGGTVLENKQYPIEKKFHWSSGKNGDVTLQIMMGDITLNRKYTGYNAFGKFLREFKDGKRTFTVKDFPEYRHEFERLGVYEIEVIYQFQPSQIMPIIRMLDTAPGRLPATIITCSQVG
jgi:type VI secretion system protein ImpL